MPQLIPAWVDGRLAPVEKLEVHRRGLRHRAASTFIIDGHNVLIQRRAASKYHSAGLWANTCCTHPGWGEPMADCVLRRLREELGIVGVYPALRKTVEYRADVGQGLIEHEVVDIFVATAPAGLGLDVNPDEVSETAWVGLYDLIAEVERRPDRFAPWLRIYLAQHRLAIFESLIVV